MASITKLKDEVSGEIDRFDRNTLFGPLLALDAVQFDFRRKPRTWLRVWA